MNIWYLIALGILVIGIIVVLVAAISSMVNIKRSMTLMESTAQKLQGQLEGIQNESNTLQLKVDHLSNDMKLKVDDVKTVVTAAKGITTSLEDMNFNVQQVASKITRKVNSDLEVQMKTEQMTNQIMSFVDKVGVRKKK